MSIKKTAMKYSLLLGLTSFLTACTVSSDLSSKDDATTSVESTPVTAPDAPVALTLQSPSSSPGNDITPTITVSGVSSGSTVALYTSSTCSGASIVASAVATSTTVNLTSDSLTAGTYTFYAMAANSKGNSPCSTVSVSYTLETTAPTLTAVAVQTGLSVDVTFSEAITSGATTAANYTVSGTGKGALSANPDLVTLVSGNTYRLTWLSGEMKNGGDITILATNATDAAGNAVFSSATHVGGGIGTAPTVTGLSDDSTPTNTKAWSWGCNEVCTYIYTVDTNATTNPSGTFSSTNSLNYGTGIGTYYLHVQASDLAGNTSSVVHVYAVLKKDIEVTVLAIPLSIREDGSGTFQVKLNGAAPNGNVVISLTSSDGSTTLSPSTLTFTSANYSTNQTVTVNGNSNVASGATLISQVTVAVSGSTAATNGWSSVSSESVDISLYGRTWHFEAYLKAPNATAGDALGNSLWGTSLYGDTLAVGAVFEDSNTTSIVHGSDLSSTNDSAADSGAVYIFKRTGTNWAHEAYLKAPNAAAGDYFGMGLSLYSDTVAVGAVYEDSNTTSIVHGSDLSSANDSGSDNGAVYVFKRTGSTWAHEAYLKTPNNSNGDQFGYSIALEGDIMVVGAPQEDSNTTAIINGSDLSSTNDSGSANGAAYVFKRTGSTWALEAYLKAPNSGSSDEFANSVSFSGDTAVVGARLEDSNTTAIINGSDLSSTNNSGSNNGAAYIYRRNSSGVWSFEAYLKAPNTTSGDEFGRPLSISGDTVAVSAYYEDSSTTSIIHGSDLSATDNSGSDTGAVYIYKRTGTTWAHEAYLKAPNPGSSDLFGRSMHLSGNVVAIGSLDNSRTTSIIHGSDLSSTDNLGTNNGAVYVYRRVGSTWHFEAYLKSPNNGDGDHFKEGISLYGDTLSVAGAFEDSSTTAIINGTDLSSTNNSSANAGAVYIFKLDQ